MTYTHDTPNPTLPPTQRPIWHCDKCRGRVDKAQGFIGVRWEDVRKLRRQENKTLRWHCYHGHCTPQWGSWLADHWYFISTTEAATKTGLRKAETRMRQPEICWWFERSNWAKFTAKAFKQAQVAA